MITWIPTSGWEGRRWEAYVDDSYVGHVTRFSSQQFATVVFVSKQSRITHGYGHGKLINFRFQSLNDAAKAFTDTIKLGG